MLSELLRHIEEKIVPPPLEELSAFVQHVRQGDNDQIPSYGRSALFDFYGKNKNGEEQGRYRVIFGRVERSFHIRHLPDGSYRVTDEGLFLYHGK